MDLKTGDPLELVLTTEEYTCLVACSLEEGVNRANVYRSLHAALARLAQERDTARASVKRLNYRLQVAESGFAEADKLRRELCTQGRGRTFGRALANWAAAHYQEQRNEAVAHLRAVLELAYEHSHGHANVGDAPETRDPECTYCHALSSAGALLARLDSQEQVQRPDWRDQAQKLLQRCVMWIRHYQEQQPGDLPGVTAELERDVQEWTDKTGGRVP